MKPWKILHTTDRRLEGFPGFDSAACVVVEGDIIGWGVMSPLVFFLLGRRKDVKSYRAEGM